MNWAEELGNSLRWLAIAFVVSSIAFFVVAFLIGRFTQWGREFLIITYEYFSWKRSKKPILILLALILMALVSVRMSVLYSYYSNDIYTAMQQLNAKAFWAAVIVFCILITIIITRALLNYYVSQLLLIDWRKWLTEKFLDKWMNNQSYYRSNYLGDAQDNPDQRIQQDIEQYVQIS